MTRRVVLVGLLIIVLVLVGCSPTAERKQEEHRPEGVVKTEPAGGAKADSTQAGQVEQNDALAKDLVCEMYPLLNKEILFKLTNNSETDISQLTMRTTFFDDKKNVITYFETYFKGVAAGQVVHVFSTSLKQYEIYPLDYHIAYKINDSDPTYVSAREHVEVVGEIKEGSGFTFNVTIRNNGPHTIDFVNAFMLFYYEGELTGTSVRHALDLAPNGSAELPFLPTLDANRRMIPYDSYEVIVSAAYYKK